MPSPLITKLTAAQMAKCSRKAVDRAILKGELRKFTLNNRTDFLVNAEVEVWATARLKRLAENRRD